MALEKCCKIIKGKKIKHPIVYIIAYPFNFFMKHCFTKIHRLAGRVYSAPNSIATAIVAFFEIGFFCNCLVGGTVA